MAAPRFGPAVAITLPVAPDQKETAVDNTTPPGAGKQGAAIMWTIIIGGILLLLAWFFRFPWGFMGY